MNTLRRLLLAAVVAGLTYALEAGAQAPSAEEAVDRYISGLLARMDQIRPLYTSDREAYFREVGEALAEFVDFREVARGVMAKYSQGPNGATDAQLDRFAGVFRASLVDFYGSALAEYGGVRYEFLENRQEARNTESASNVRMAVIADDGSSVEVQYTMFLDDAGVWKLRNLYIEGVNLRRQYYSRFDDLMTRNNFNIDTVIDLWSTEQ